jgi:sugar transferase (PEP-CTERM/EpsH1 system associated)
MIGSDGSPPPSSIPSKRNLLFLTQRIPYPPIKGEKIRPLQILKHFRKTYNVYLGCLVDDPEDWKYVETVRSLCTDAYFASLNRGWDNISHVSALLKGEALSVALYHSRALTRWVSQVIRQIDFDVIFVCSSNMAPYVLDHARYRSTCMVDLADVDSEKWRAYAEKASGAMKWIYRREARLVSDLETRIAHAADFSTFVSEPEAETFRKLVPGRASTISGVPSGVDYSYFDPHERYPAPFRSERPTFVFTGTMDYIPNVDAVSWFAKDILPVIKRTLPEAQFYIVGSNPSAAVEELTMLPDVYVTGRVPDVRPYLAHATAGVAPMRIARGIQNKVMEAMAMAKPVIVTSGALEGIDAETGQELLLANDVDTFAAIACRLAQDEGERVRVGEAARRRMVEDFSWEGRLSGFDRLLDGARP